MKLVKEKVALKDAPKADLPFGLKLPALAWTDPEFPGRVFYVVAGRRRFAHEARHELTGLDNVGMHHHWAHFCISAGHALRLRNGKEGVCFDARDIRAADALLSVADGVGVTV